MMASLRPGRGPVGTDDGMLVTKNARDVVFVHQEYRHHRGKLLVHQHINQRVERRASNSVAISAIVRPSNR